jgi:hypothetical protein
MPTRDLLALVEGLRDLGVQYFKNESFEVALGPTPVVQQAELPRDDTKDPPRWRGLDENELFGVEAP